MNDALKQRDELVASFAEVVERLVGCEEFVKEGGKAGRFPLPCGKFRKVGLSNSVAIQPTGFA